MNSLVLHCASPAAHNIATSKVAVIFNMFNGHLKRGNKAPFCSRNAFNSDFDYSTRLKSVYLETRPSLFEENYHLKPKWFFSCCCFLCDEKGTVTLLFCLCSLLVVATQKSYLKEKNSGQQKLYCFRYECTGNSSSRVRIVVAIEIETKKRTRNKSEKSW